MEELMPDENETTDNIESILNAARHLFNSPGYTSARVADIAKLAGVSRATVYNNFEDKQAILDRLVRDYMAGYQEIGIRLQKAAKPTDTIFELLGQMLRDTFMWRIQNADLRPAIEVAKQLPGSAWTEANHAALLKE
jgi:AcrR family transcriptional regulator